MKVALVALNFLISLLFTHHGVQGDVAPSFVETEGQSQDDIAESMEQVYEELTEQIPEEAKNATSKTAIIMEVTDDDIKFVEEQQQNTTQLDHLGNGAADSPAVIGFVKSLPEVVGTTKGNDRFVRGVLMRTDVNDEGLFGYIWAFTVTSPGAKALRLKLEDVHIPEGSELRVMNKKSYGLGRQVDGPYFRHGPDSESKSFWSRSLAGDTMTVVVNATRLATEEAVQSALNEVTLHVTEVAHVLGQVNTGTRRKRRLRNSFVEHEETRELKEDDANGDYWPCSRNGECFQDPNCHNENNPVVEHAMKAVAKLEWISDGKIMSCTGTLVADTDLTTNSPLMLSAAHCFHGNSFKDLEVFFYHTTDKCEGTCPGSVLNKHTQRTSDVVGMSLLRDDKRLDYALIRLHVGENSALPKGVAFLGWKADPVSEKDGKKLYRLSTPNYGALVYTEHEVDVTQMYRCGMKRGETIHSQYIIGGTAFGSSGSPLIDDEANIVGTLMGKCGPNIDDSCATHGYRAVDSAFAHFYPKIKEFLNPKGERPECFGDRECKKTDDPCKLSACVEHKCVELHTTSDCNVGHPCYTDDKCNAGTCQPGTWICDYKEKCDTDEDCATKGFIKGKTCNLKECISGQCRTVTARDGAFCDDNDFCTFGDRCSKGKCVSGERLCHPQSIEGI